MKQMLFVFNPRSGKEQIRGSLLRILDIFTKAGYDIHVHVTQCQGDAAQTVRKLRNYGCDRMQRRGRHFK